MSDFANDDGCKFIISVLQDKGYSQDALDRKLWPIAGMSRWHVNSDRRCKVPCHRRDGFGFCSEFGVAIDADRRA